MHHRVLFSLSSLPSQFSCPTSLRTAHENMFLKLPKYHRIPCLPFFSLCSFPRCFQVCWWICRFMPERFHCFPSSLVLLHWASRAQLRPSPSSQMVPRPHCSNSMLWVLLSSGLLIYPRMNTCKCLCLFPFFLTLYVTTYQSSCIVDSHLVASQYGIIFVPQSWASHGTF